MKKDILLCSLALAITLLAPASSAQTGAGARGEAEALTDKAGQLYDEGLAALNQARWAEAHASFLAAWRIKQHYQIAANLGVAELRLGKHRDAAEHLSWYLREAPAERTAQRQRAEVLLKEALAKVAAITITTEPKGADVKVNGAAAGRTPLALPVFLEPGRHVVGAELDGYKPAQEQIEPAAGHAIGITLHLVRRDAEAPAAAGASSAAGPRAASHAAPAKRPETTAAPPTERSWVPVIVLGAASAVALGVGVGLTVAANDATADARSQQEEIFAGGGGCLESPAFAGACREFRRTTRRSDDLSNAAVVTYAASGAMALTAVALALWPRESAAGHAAVRVVPGFGVRSAGIAVRTTW
ncbi:PEGA domain-containing protein [Sorangium sp. So ce362]|uniref:PEGA domain-containing protein n=1 Tax=Sorangium sp. So ce362 TaxID=3133303 RepID=UPI003F602FB9